MRANPIGRPGTRGKRAKISTTVATIFLLSVGDAACKSPAAKGDGQDLQSAGADAGISYPGIDGGTRTKTSCPNPLDIDSAKLQRTYEAHKAEVKDSGIPADLTFERRTAPVGIPISDLKTAAKRCSVERNGGSAPVLPGITNIGPPPECFFKTRQVGASKIATGIINYFGWLSGVNNALADLYSVSCRGEESIELLVDKKSGDVLAIQKAHSYQADYAGESYRSAVEKLRTACPVPVMEFSGNAATREDGPGVESTSTICDDGDVRTVVSHTSFDGQRTNMFSVAYFSLHALRSYLDVATANAVAKDEAARNAAQKGL